MTLFSTFLIVISLVSTGILTGSNLSFMGEDCFVWVNEPVVLVSINGWSLFGDSEHELLPHSRTCKRTYLVAALS